MLKRTVLLGLLWTIVSPLSAQVLGLEEAMWTALNNYEKIKSKEYLLAASKQDVDLNKRSYLPNLTIAAQQNYGTINAQNGPLYNQGGMGVGSSSMPMAEQSWNAAFGSLYLANLNWEVYTFGRLKNQVRVAEYGQQVSERDLTQEIFEHQIKVAAAYLNLLAAQRLTFVQNENLNRATVFMTTTVSRVESGLLPGVDASLARAEVSQAKSAWIKARDMEFEYSKNLSVLMGIAYQEFELDSAFLKKTPVNYDLSTQGFTKLHPYLEYQESKIGKSVQQESLLRSENLPSLSLFGVFQGRGSGFESNYVQDQSAFSKNYWDGVGVQRSNYVLGIGLSWNIATVFRNQSKIRRQQNITKSLRSDYKLTNQDLLVQLDMAEAKVANALDNFNETPVQLKAAAEAYRQSTALYDNGLSTVVDLTQALYTLNRAEADYEIAFNNVWQALLLKSASSGDLELFLSEIKIK